MASMTVQLRGKGAITLPADLRSRYGLQEGDVFTLVDLGDGSFFLTPRLLQVERLGDEVGRLLEEADTSVEDVLKVLQEERERYYHDHYVQD